MRLKQALKRVGFVVLGVLVFYPFLVAFVCWLMTLWQTYVTLVVVSAICYWRLRSRLGARTSRTQSRAFLERVPYEPGLGAVEARTEEWEP